MTLAAEMVADAAALERLAPAWDALAVRCAEPIGTPAWMLAWLRHVAPAGALPRVVAVRDGDELVGLAPFYLAGDDGGPAIYRVMADDFSSNVALLAVRDRFAAVAAAVAAALAAARPAPAALVLAPLSVQQPWARELAAAWPGPIRPLTARTRREESATVVLDGTFDAWMAARGSQFRKTVRRRARAFEREGGVVRLGTTETLDRDLDAFVRLHAARWNGRGESRLLALGDRLGPLLREVATATTDERVRLWVAELDGEPVCADLSLVAGGEIVGVNTGWDDRWKRFSPAQLVTVRKIEDACARGERRLHMGWGTLDYKRAFADGDDPVAWDVLIPAGRGALRGLAAYGPAISRYAARAAALRTLPPATIERARSASRRVLRRR